MTMTSYSPANIVTVRNYLVASKHILQVAPVTVGTRVRSLGGNNKRKLTSSWETLSTCTDI